MRYRLAVLFLVIIWSLLNRLMLKPSGRLLGLISDRIRDQLTGRVQSRQSMIALASVRRKFDDCVLFFCSSAGEYEQARPIIDRLSVDGNVFCHVVFFSASGPKFVQARKDAISWSLAPLDDVFYWGSFYAALRPSVTFIVRHELWPSFLWMAAEWSKIVVINAVVPALLGRQSQLRESINLMTKAWLFRFVDLVCVVSPSDQQFFSGRLGIPLEKLKITGDTKYDRVLERAATAESRVVRLRELLRQKWQVPGSDLILIGGSVHLPDVAMIVEALQDDRLNEVKVLLVPHDVSSSNIANMFEMISNRGFSVELYSEVKAADFDFSATQPRFIIVDELGRLFDLYAVGDFAWVGGAVHDKVHNVLEPAAMGIPVTCGSRMENSQEAIAMRKAGLLWSATDASAARDVWIKIIGELKDTGQLVKNFAHSMAGAAEKVLEISKGRTNGVASRD